MAVDNKKMIFFGGVYDEQETEDRIVVSTFYKDIVS